jgi:hypothetical protein
MMTLPRWIQERPAYLTGGAETREQKARENGYLAQRGLATHQAPLSDTSKHSVSNVLPMNKLLLPPPNIPLCGA